MGYPMTTRLKHLQAGLSMIELMVGMTIGLIGTVIISSALVSNEDFKRRTTSTSDAQINGTLALYAIERDLRMAGFGFANTNAFGCSNVTYSHTSFSGAYPTWGLLPSVITDGGAVSAGATASDSIRLVYATEVARSTAGVLAATQAAGAASFSLVDTTGFNGSVTTRGDLVVAVSGTTCSLHQVTALAGTTVNTASGTAPFNGTASPGYASGAYLFNLGLPVVRSYSVGTNQSLQMLDVFATSSSNSAPSVSSTPTTITSGIVDLQAQYGLDTNGDLIIDSYSNTTPTTAAGWAQVLAVRVAVLVRAGTYIRPDTPGGACSATTTAPSWSGGTHYMSDGLPSCYKYRSFETVVPLRNMIWKEA